jgi:hypothetical protein
VPRERGRSRAAELVSGPGGIVDGRTRPPNEGMKLTKLSPAPGQMEAPSSALQRFALVRTASQLIPGVGRTYGGP